LFVVYSVSRIPSISFQAFKTTETKKTAFEAVTK